MDADRFRRRLEGALGEPPDLGPAVHRLEDRLASLQEPRPAGRSASAMAVVAGALAVLVIATLMGTRMLTAHRSQPAAAPTAPTAASSACRLPLVERTSQYPQKTVAAGFVAVDSGTFQPDASAPGDAMTYDRVARRWLPVRPPAIAPDHSAYAYVVDLKESFQLHVHQIASGADRVVWAAPGGGGGFPIIWTSSGIEITTSPSGGGNTTGWVVPPAGGQPKKAPVQPITPEFVRTDVGTSFPDALHYEATFQGMSIVRDPDGGVYLLAPDKSRTLIHAAGPDFDPSTFIADGSRLWAVNADGSAIWLWTQAGGLQQLPLHVTPQASVTYWAAGPCA